MSLHLPALGTALTVLSPQGHCVWCGRVGWRRVVLLQLDLVRYWEESTAKKKTPSTSSRKSSMRRYQSLPCRHHPVLRGFPEVSPVLGSPRTKIRAERSSNARKLRSAEFTPSKKIRAELSSNGSEVRRAGVTSRLTNCEFACFVEVDHVQTRRGSQGSSLAFFGFEPDSSMRRSTSPAQRAWKG